MRFALTSMALTGALVLSPPQAAVAGPIEVVSASDDHARFHPRPRPEAAAAEAEDFPLVMDRVFGEGRWRLTSGYRSQAQENALRRRGAGVVAPGHVSLHSVGGPQAPGAYDAVVDRLSPAQAAAKLRRDAAGGAFRILAERAHGPEGPHLHVELISLRASQRRAAGD